MDSSSSTSSLPSVVPTDLKERLVNQLKHSVGMLNNLKTLVEGREICERYSVPQNDPNIVDDSFITILKEIREVLDKLQEHCEKLLPPGQATTVAVEEDSASGPVELRDKKDTPIRAVDSGYVASQEIRTSTSSLTAPKSVKEEEEHRGEPNKTPLQRSSLTAPKSVKEEEEEHRGEPNRAPCEHSDSEVLYENKSDSSDN